MKPVAWYRIEGDTHVAMPFRSDPDADKHGWSPAYRECPADQLAALTKELGELKARLWACNEACKDIQQECSVNQAREAKLCALLEKVEEALNISAIHCNGAPWVVVHKALAAIKQWKEKS